jgi:LAO/AO transport system kinase
MAMRRLPTDPAELVEAVVDGDRRALARVLSLVERGDADAREIGRLVYPRAGQATTLGITGAPGAGKSTLTSALVAHARSVGERPAVLAVDPSSPFSGGAILGDRVRMAEHALDTEVFIRSMATRGHLGGLTLAVPEAIRVLDAAGFAWVIVETVGVGQVEVEIVSQADTTVVVVNPGWGDAVQANKAGLMEIADVFVINKADRDGVRQTRHDLKAMLQMGDARGWTPPIIEAVATEGQGAAELWDAIGEHQKHLRATGELEIRRSRRLRDELESVVTERLRQRAAELTGADGSQGLIEQVQSGETDPYTAADELLGPLGA